jgi:class 3 adenylate cyclase/CHASE2 domain-containing sensor protein
MAVAETEPSNEAAASKPRRLRLPRGAVSVLLIALLSLAAGVFLPRIIPMLGWSENWVKDIRISLFPYDSRPVRQDMAVLAITEETLGTLRYRSPIDRGFLASLLDRLERAEVRAVVFDILFDRETEVEKDERLRRRLLAFPKPVVVVWAEPPKQIEAGVEVKRAFTSVSITEAQAEYLRRYTEGARRGHANLIRDDNDGAVRWINVTHREAAPPARGITEALRRFLLKTLGKDDTAKPKALGPGLPAAVVQALGLPVPAVDSLPLDYAVGPWDDHTQEYAPAIPTFEAHLAPVLPDSFFRGKIIFIGADLPEADRYRTPFAAGLGVARGVLPGVTIHAHAVAQLIDGRELKETGPAGEALIIALAVLIGVLIAAYDLKVGTKLLLSAGALILTWTALFSAYPLSGYLVPLISPTLGFGLAVIGISFYQQRRYLEERTFIRGALSRYVPEGVVKQLEAEPSRLKLGGERKELTYLFTDIAGFTSLSEHTEPAVLVATLNEYLDGATKVVFDHRGSIDKYIGDAVVAIFGAFDESDNHARDAIACALALDRFASDFAERQKRERGLDFGDTRIGVNTGFAIIGNFGGEAQFDYTAVGDTVNTAARLEGANKYLGTRVCIAGSTVAKAGGFNCRPIGELQVKGRNEYLPVFEPLAEDDPRQAYLAEYLAIYSQSGDDPAAALAAIDALLARPEAAGDGLLQMHRERLADLLNTPRRRKSDGTLQDRWTEIALTDK